MDSAVVFYSSDVLFGVLHQETEHLAKVPAETPQNAAGLVKKASKKNIPSQTCKDTAKTARFENVQICIFALRP